MDTRCLKYLLPVTLCATGYVAFAYRGYWTWLPTMYAFILLPALEFIIIQFLLNITYPLH